MIIPANAQEYGVSWSMIIISMMHGARMAAILVVVWW